MGIHRRRLCTGTVIQHTATDTAGIPVTQLPTSTVTPFQSPVFTLTPIPPTSILARMITLTSRVIPPTLTPTITRTATPISTVTNTPTVLPGGMKYECIHLATDLPPEAVSEGFILLADYNDFTAYRLDTRSWAKQSITIQKLAPGSMLDFAVSPDRKHLALEYFNKQSWLVVVSVDGSQQKIIQEKDDWGDFDWLDNERLIINHQSTPGGLASLILLNPFTGKQQELKPLADIPLDEPPFWGMYTNSRAVYDPTLTRVVYPVMGAGVDIAFRDVQTGKDLATLAALHHGDTPKWSPDGKQVAFVADTLTALGRDPWYFAEELYSFGWNGEINRLTHMTDNAKSVKILEFSWSPDGRSIAFWVNFVPNAAVHNYQLSVLDLATGDNVNYCVDGDPLPDHHILRNDSAPIWSPDGSQLLVEARDPNDESEYWVILVDIVHGWAAKIAENLAPVGWMVSP